MSTVRLAMFVAAVSRATVVAGDGYNVLFLVVDDLRPQFNLTYGHSETHTPYIDRLASQSLVFDRAFCQEAVCAPSRNSFMTGRRPDTTKAWNFIDHFREAGVGKDWISLPEYFKKNGYLTLGGGKLYHPNLPPNNDEPLSWSQDVPYFPLNTSPCPSGTKTPFCAVDAPDDEFFDTRLANHTMSLLSTAAKQRNPFFIGAGFRRPHVPWRTPTRFFSRYNASQLTIAEHREAPTNMPDIAFTTEGEADIHHWPQAFGPHDPEPLEAQRELRRGYYAAVTFVDEQIGRVLETVDQLGFAKDTVVVLFGDHGWQLGEHGEWAKHTNFDLAARVPLMFRVPWKSQAMGKRTSGIAELVDVYPTLVELAGLPLPPDVEGTSLASYFDNPSQASTKEAAFSQFPRCPRNLTRQWDQNICLEVKRENFYSMGYSVRTADYRYTEWLKWNGSRLHGEWDQLLGAELYDHSGDDGRDFDAFENVNLADDKTLADVREKLHALLLQNFGK